MNFYAKARAVLTQARCMAVDETPPLTIGIESTAQCVCEEHELNGLDTNALFDAVEDLLNNEMWAAKLVPHQPIQPHHEFYTRMF